MLSEHQCHHEHHHEHHHKHSHEHQQHEHECGSCACGHEHRQLQGVKGELTEISIALALFLSGFLLGRFSPIAEAVLFAFAYILLGRDILKLAFQNIRKGHIFDENFLMSIATLAAFAIGDFAEAAGVMLFYRVGELCQEMASQKSRNRIMDAVDMRPETVQLEAAKGLCTIPASEAKVGDILLVRAGDRIPLDSVVLEGESRIDTAPVTGEAVPVRVGVGDRVISGCVNTSGVLKIRVEKTLEDSMVTRILHSVEHASANKPKIDRFITRFARVYTPIVVFVAMATAMIPSLIFGDWKHWIYTAITFLVISCPCALVISIPLAFFAGIGSGSKKGILFKGGLAIEALSRVSAVVVDKTGTVTRGDFKVQKCIAYGAYSEEQVLNTAAECEMHSTHPIALSIVEEAGKRELFLREPENITEVAGKGICAVIDGRKILCGNKSLLDMYEVEITKEEMREYGTEVFVACEGKMIGRIIISDTVKEDAKEAIARLKERKMKTFMLTGDTKESARAVAEITGVEAVYAKLLPDEKAERLREIRNRHGKVLFVGDGMNDAPVLAGADVGAAMGDGADAAIEAADVVFMTSSVMAIPEALDIAASTKHIAIQNIVFALGIKMLIILLGFFGLANMWMAVFADTGVAMLCVLNSVRILKRK